ncbi:vacuolar protein sorting-associated protein 53 homolog [Zophobas morio]|uniref:vacuolar protein sorting-associated protein 53 homolog n=1 Tax=Zophobas morio TaxID=2755281 RepID=UPI0030827F8B
MVQEITRDIKSLDFAKRNLTASINSLNRLHMLIAGVESLKNMSEKRQYRDAAYLLQALNHIIPEFDRFSDMKKIKEIYDEFRKTQILLKRQIREEFSDFCSTKQTVFTVEVKKLLHDACLVLEALGEEVVADLVDWLIRLELNEYKIIFSPNSEASDLNKVKRRYTWCKRVVSNFEECWADVFPASWKLSKKLFLMFCAWCRKDLSNLLKQNEDSLSVKLLLLLIGETLTFEKHLATRFPTFPEAKETEFEGIISSCFEAYMNIYVEAQEKILSTLVEEAVSDAKKTQKSFPVEKNALLSLGTAKNNIYYIE